MKRCRCFASIAAVAALVGLQAVFVASYVGRERTIYFWDHAMYFDMARQFYLLCGQNPAGAWEVFKNALSDNYNLIFALPSLAGFALFGAARQVFILTNFFVFFLAYEIAIAFLLRRALGLNWSAALVISLAAVSLVPPLWLPLLEGYPDIGAAVCIVLAFALLLNGPGSSRSIRRGLATGLLLGFSILLRRHFAYAAIALLAARAGFALWDIAHARGGKRRFIASRMFIYLSTCCLGCAALIALVAPDFLRAALTTNYNELYLSYRKPALVFLRFVLGGFGSGLLLIAASGLFMLARANAAGRRLAAFTALFVFLWLTVWCGGPDQIGHHYILQALPLAVVAGFAGWVLYLRRERSRIIYVLGGAFVLFLVANSAWALWFSPTGVWPNDNGAPGLLSAARPPVVRSDYDEWLRLARYLQDTSKPGDTIMLVGSSFVFNLDLLRSVYEDIFGDTGMIARFPKPPEIDHEEPAPLNIFAAADIYVVPTPAQYHLDPAGQRVVTAAANRFPPAPLFASLFRSDAASFRLADGVTVKIWRRAPWTPGLLHKELADIRRDAPRDSHFSQDWVTVTMPRAAQIHTGTDNRSWVDGIFDAGHKDLDLFFDYPLEPGTYNLGFSLIDNCGGAHMHLEVAGADGNPKDVKDFPPAPMGEMSQTFAVPAKTDKDHFLTLALAFAPAALCRAELSGLRLERLP